MAPLFKKINTTVVSSTRQMKKWSSRNRYCFYFGKKILRSRIVKIKEQFQNILKHLSGDDIELMLKGKHKKFFISYK